MHVSDILLPVEEEAVYFNGLFDIDIKADTDNIYIISGKRKITLTPQINRSRIKYNMQGVLAAAIPSAEILPLGVCLYLIG